MRRTYFIIAIMMVISTASFAQRNNRSNQRRRTGTSVRQNQPRRTPTTTSQPKQEETIPELSSRCMAVYKFKNYRREMGSDKIYIVNSSEDNAVYSIDYNTGNVNLEIKGVAEVYEGARPKFIQVRPCGGELLVTVGTGKYAGVYVYDGNSVNTSKKFDGSLYVMSTNENCALIVYGPEWDKEKSVELWDIKEMKKLTGYKVLDEYGSPYSYFGWLNFRMSFDPGPLNSDSSPILLASNNSMWRTDSQYDSGGCFNILPVEAGDVIITPELNKQEYVTSFIEEKNASNVIGFSYGHVGYGKYYCILRGDYMYVAYNRRIYRMNTNTCVWEEFLKMPLSINNSFSQFGVAPDGTVYSDGVNGVQIFYPGKYDKPVELGMELVFSFADYLYNKFPSRYYQIRTDPKGNFIILNGDGVYIYNPKGIVGYKNAVGRQVKITD